MSEEIELGGRKFRVIDFDRRTVLHDHYLQSKIRASGVGIPMDGEGHVDYIVRVHAALIDSGIAHELAAGYLLPLDKTEADFTRAMAKDIAAHIATCTGNDCDKVNDLVGQVALGFYKRELVRLSNSIASINASQAQPEEPDQIPTVH